MQKIYGISEICNFKNNYKKEKTIFFKNTKFTKFKKINESQKEEIFNNAYLWNEMNSNCHLYEKLFNLYYHLNHIKNIVNNDELFLFLIFVLDPELKLLQIYYEESKINRINQRFLEEFGFKLDTRLLILEKSFNNKFPTIIDEFEHSFSK